MRGIFLAAPVLACLVVLNGATAEADPLAGAPTVHVQPRAKNFRPHSRASEAEQRRLSAFDAKQQKLDAAFDRKLDNCGC
jgi:hypothetical protein